MMGKRFGGLPTPYVRSKLLKRDGNACYVCGLPMRTKDTLSRAGRDFRWNAITMTIEHLSAGDDRLHRLRLSHKACNTARGAAMQHNRALDKDALRARMQALLDEWEAWKAAGCPPVYEHRNGERVLKSEFERFVHGISQVTKEELSEEQKRDE